MSDKGFPETSVSLQRRSGKSLLLLSDVEPLVARSASTRILHLLGICKSGTDTTRRSTDGLKKMPAVHLLPPKQPTYTRQFTEEGGRETKFVVEGPYTIEEEKFNLKVSKVAQNCVMLEIAVLTCAYRQKHIR